MLLLWLTLCMICLSYVVMKHLTLLCIRTITTLPSVRYSTQWMGVDWQHVELLSNCHSGFHGVLLVLLSIFCTFHMGKIQPKSVTVSKPSKQQRSSTIAISFMPRGSSRGRDWPSCMTAADGCLFRLLTGCHIWQLMMVSAQAAYWLSCITSEDGFLFKLHTGCHAWQQMLFIC